jgi:hypothetical protein
MSHFSTMLRGIRYAAATHDFPCGIALKIDGYDLFVSADPKGGEPIVQRSLPNAKQRFEAKEPKPKPTSPKQE